MVKTHFLVTGKMTVLITGLSLLLTAFTVMASSMPPASECVVHVRPVGPGFLEADSTFAGRVRRAVRHLGVKVVRHPEDANLGMKVSVLSETSETSGKPAGPYGRETILNWTDFLRIRAYRDEKVVRDQRYPIGEVERAAQDMMKELGCI
jgi:hypothetical protein